MSASTKVARRGLGIDGDELVEARVNNSRIILFACVGSAVLACGSEPTNTEFRSVTPVCVEEAPAEEIWTCDEVLAVECREVADDIELHVQLEEKACADADLQDVDVAPGPGEHKIAIEDAATGETVCEATLEIVDTEVPVVDTEELRLWPPNHKYHDVTLDDCMTVDECDPDWDARIVSVSSDEPVNDLGDGNTEPDIVPVDEHTVSLRSERQGGSNGRVYTIDFVVEDSSGNATEAHCLVAVVHDQSGAAAVDDGAAYDVEWPD